MMRTLPDEGPDPGSAGKASVVLVSMPFAALSRPSMALASLTAAARREGIDCLAMYPMFEYARSIGVPLYRAISEHGDPADLVGEWLFAAEAFDAQAATDDAFLAYALRPDWYTRAQYAQHVPVGTDLVMALCAARDRSAGFIATLAQRIAAGRPRVVGCTSTFQQHCASIALLRALKRLDPGIITLLGGANCEGPMGAATARVADGVDYVVSGEADELFPRLVDLALQHGPNIPPGKLPSSVRRGRTRPDRLAALTPAPTRQMVEALDNLPLPDFDAYFAELANHRDLDLAPTLLVETSRGCWYGERRHCSFCGLNGGGMRYRSKAARKVLDELEALSTRHGLREFEAVDNILDSAYFKTLLPALAAEPQRRYSLFFECKSNLREHHVAALAAAGIWRVQPGIESFHDGVLHLLNKGGSATQNVAVLRLAQEYGLRVSYNVIFGVPGEQPAWYEELAAWLPRIVHLEPPRALVRLRFDRFSPYHDDPDRFGVRLTPNRSYALVYPLAPKDLNDLAYYFEDESQPQRGDVRQEHLNRLWSIWSRWRDAHAEHGNGRANGSSMGPMLMSVDDAEETTILDRRPGARQSIIELTGLPHRVLRQCRWPTTRTALVDALAPSAEPALLAACTELCEAGLLIEAHGKFVTVAPRATAALLRWGTG